MKRIPFNSDSWRELFGERGEVVQHTTKFGAHGPTTIRFESGAFIFIIDSEHEHRVEAFAP